MQNQTYRRLSFQERVIIQTLWEGGESKTFIANRLKRNKSTITREINKWEKHPDDKYKARLADWYVRDNYLNKRCFDKIQTHSLLRFYVYKGLLKHWTPEQIAGRIKLKYPNNPVMTISHEAIYAHIYRHRQAKLNLKLIALLPSKRTRRRLNHKSRGVSKFKVTDKVSIDKRPDFINNRSQIGHWEGDLIIGQNRASALITLVERKSRFTLILKVPNKKSETVTEEIRNLFSQIPNRLRRSITYDNGVEMANHLWLTRKTGTKVYFAHPYSSWERGTNENTNGIIRRYYPKKTDFHKLTYQELIELQNKLNNRPRKILGYKTPAELFKFNVDHCNYYSVNVRK